MKLQFLRLITVLFAAAATSFGVIDAEVLNWNLGRGYLPFDYAESNGILIDNQSDTLQYSYYALPYPSSETSLDFRVRNLHGEPMKSYPYKTENGETAKIKNPHWGFFIVSPSDTLIVTVKQDESQGMMGNAPALNMNVYQGGKGEKVSLTENINTGMGDNLWRVISEDNRVSIYASNHSLTQRFAGDFLGDVTLFGFLAGWGEKVLIRDIRAEIKEEVLQKKWGDENFSYDYLNEYFRGSNDEIEGFWTLFDRELEESLLRLGGRYLLAAVKTEDGYDFLYIEGAEVNSSSWHPGDVKLRLSPSSFRGIYDVEWTDAMKNTMNHDIRAQEGEGNTLMIQFPYQSSRLRLRKVDKAE